MKEQRLDILQKVANGELTPEQADKQLLGLSIVGVSLPIESFDVDDWLGQTHGVWYHPFIELHNYDNGDKKSIELSQIIADYANSIIQQLTIPAVMESVCSCSKGKGIDHDEDGKAYCIDCGKYLEQTIP
jgi:hypothetical protein